MLTLKDIEELRSTLKANYTRFMTGLDWTAELVAAGGKALEPVLPEPTPEPKPAPVQQERKKQVKAAKSTAKPVKKSPYITTNDALRACAQLAQPFNAEQVSKATGGSFKSATSMISRWFDKGYLERAAYGKYRRTKAHPVPHSPAEPKPTSGPTPGIIRPPTPPAKERVSIPGLDEPELTLEQKLEKALKARDKAVAEGNETMARIQQDKIDKFEAELEAR